MRASVSLATLAMSASLSYSSAALAQPLAMNEPAEYPYAVFEQTLPAVRAVPRYESTALSKESPYEIPSHLRRQVVSYSGRESPGTIVIDTPNTYLYYVLGNGRAIRYGIGVGREGFTWSGMYLGNTAYRIHGTNAPDTIGKRVSSGCIRLTNEDIKDLYEHVKIGAKVVVLSIQPTTVSGLRERNRSRLESVRAVAVDRSAGYGLY
jgi:lipoprotein-anchoring transpeptidase ErfK/SrfK